MRLAIVAVVFAVAATVALILRARQRPVPAVVEVSMSPGVYFFSSVGCADCLPAREALEAALGPEGYTEIKWEEQPGRFEEVGVDAVPSTVLVTESGSAEVFPGNPGPALQRLGP